MATQAPLVGERVKGSAKRPASASAVPIHNEPERAHFRGAGAMPGNPWSIPAELDGNNGYPSLPLQRKLAVGASDDPLETEADRAAAQVMRIPEASLSLSAGALLLRRKCACESSGHSCAECSKKKQENLQRKSIGPDSGMSARTIVHQVLQSPGQPLDAGIRSFMEPRFQADFSRVRVHTDDRAAESARAVHALAYTVGDRIVFASGRYSPHSDGGRLLLAHELAHTIQQSSVQPTPGNRVPVGHAHGPEEQTAETAGADVRAGQPASMAPGMGRLNQPTLQRTPDPITASTDFSATVSRLEQLIRTGGAVPTDTRVICAAIVDVEGYKGPKEIRTISAAATDPLGQGAAVAHPESPPPGTRTLSATRSIAGGGARREFPFSHINDAEMKAFESITRNMPENPKGSVHFLTMRVRQVGGKTVFEPMPACSGCTRATFEMGNFKGVNMISHAAVHPTGTLDLSEGPPHEGPGKKPPGGGGGEGGEGGEGGPDKGTPGGGGKGPVIGTLLALPEGTEVRPASPAEILERQRVVSQFEAESAESVRFSARLQAYGAVFGGLMQIYSAVNTVNDALQFAADGTKFPAEQAKAEQLLKQSTTDLASANTVTEGISLLGALAAVSQALQRGDGDVLFELSDTLGNFGMPLKEAADKAAAMADSLERRVKAIGVLKDYFEKMVDLPVDPMAGTIPQSQAFTVYQSLEKFLGPLTGSGRNYRTAATTLGYYADYTLGLAHEANKAAWTLALRRLVQSAQAAQAAQKNAPPPPPPTRRQAVQPPPPPPALLPTPGPVQTPQKFEPLPFAPGPSPIREAEGVVANFKAKALSLIARGQKLTSSSPSNDEIKAFAHDEQEWRTAATMVMKHYADHGPDVGRSGMDEVLNSDQYGGRLKQIRQTFGE